MQRVRVVLLIQSECGRQWHWFNNQYMEQGRHAYYVTKWRSIHTQYQLLVEKKMAKRVFLKTGIVALCARVWSGFTCMCK